MTPEAIKEIIKGQSIQEAYEALVKAMQPNDLGQTVGIAALPADFKVHDLEGFLPHRRHMRGKLLTNSIKSFLGYCDKHGGSGSEIFVDPYNMSAKAVLNKGSSYAAGHCDHVARLELEATAEYRALLERIKESMSQQKMAEFFEDWRDHLQFWDSMDADGQPIPFHKAVGAIRRLSIESARKVESVEKSLGASMSTFESVEATSADPIPQLVYFKCKPYAELEARTFALRLAILTTGDKPMVRLNPIRFETHRQEMGEQFAGLLASADRAIFLGMFND